MNVRSTFSATVIILILSMAFGCSGTGSNTPVVSNGVGSNLSQGTPDQSYSSHILWGLYEIALNGETLQAEITPLRSAEFNANVTMFMQPPLSPTNRISVFIDMGLSDIPNGLFAVDITLNHPFPGIGQFSGFDVRGIFMANGSEMSDHYTGLTYASDGEARLLNADGWTRWWNPTEFTTYGKIFGYTQGAFASKNFTATATLNPYKYFADTVGKDDNLYIIPESRGFFSTMPGLNKRQYMIQFPVSGGSPVVKFNYAVDASYDTPTGGGPNYSPDDWTLSANCQEAYQINVSDAGSSAWYVSGTKNGGDLSIDIKVYDWQAPANPGGVPGEINAIWIESPELLSAPVNILPTATVSPDGPTSSVFHVELTGVTPDGLISQTLLIAVESKSPSNYAPNIPGITGFAYPDQPLAAFLFWDAPILDKEPMTIPVPQNLNNNASYGLVQLFWDPVTWPTLAGYNIYRRLSTEPSYNFASPLNPSPVANTLYNDTNVLTDGTTYKYVVKAVDNNTQESLPSNETTATPAYMGPNNLDNCAAAGVVKLFWGAVPAPPVTVGYNVYRKLSTETNFNFSTPLNSALVAGLKYLDNTVLMNGTAYDYVVTAVDSTSKESLPSNITSATPVYNVPTGFTDQDDPDLQLSTSSASNFTNCQLTPDGKFHVTNGHIPYLLRGNISTGIVTSQTQISWNQSGGHTDVAVDSQGNAHVIYPDWYVATCRMHYAKITPAGAVQNTAVILICTYPDTNPPEVTIAVTPNDEVHMIVPGYSGGHNLTYIRGTPGNWSAPQIITTDVYANQYHSRPDCASDIYGNVHVVWTGPGSTDIRYMKRDAAGTWSSPVVASTGVSGAKGCPAVATDNHGTAHVAWSASFGGQVGYSNNRTGTFVGQAVTGALCPNIVGIACDRDGNAYVDWYTSAARIGLALISRTGALIENDFINGATSGNGSWCCICGVIDPCYTSNTSIMATWRNFGGSIFPYASRISTDY